LGIVGSNKWQLAIIGQWAYDGVWSSTSPSLLLAFKIKTKINHNFFLGFRV
jgi:hypothetical protein